MMDRETYEAICELSKMKKRIQCWTKEEVEKDKESINTNELGEAIDMIKDLAEAEKYCCESMYYRTVIDAMDGANETYRMGYDSRRVMNKPFIDQEPYIEDYLDGEMERMGYSRSGRGSSGGNRGRSMGGSRGRSSSGSRSMSSGYQNGSEYYDEDMDPSMYPEDRWPNNQSNRYGDAYRQYRMMRRNYTESGNKADKEEMDARAQEHIMDMGNSIKDIWKGADSEQKKKLKAELQSLMSDLN